MADWLPADHLVWFILDLVTQFDTTALHRRHPVAGPGRAAYDPDMLLGLLMYAYATGERSSRRIERLCGEHVAFRIVCAQDIPDHTTISRFRQTHETVFADLFAQVLVLCADAGMGRVGTVAIDGTKIAANASRGANRSEEHVRALAKQIIDEAAATDAAEDAADSGDQGQLPPQWRDRSGRRERIKQALAEYDRKRKAADDADQAQAERIENFLATVESGESIEGAAPGGTDPVRHHQARLTGALLRAERAPNAVLRSEARRQARRAKTSLDKALATPTDSATNQPRAPQKRRPKVPDWVNLTDPDSLMVGCPDGGVIQGYNVQLAVTDDHLILATGITPHATDYPAFEPMMTAATQAAEVFNNPDGTPGVIDTITADAGYLSHKNLLAPGPDRLIAIGKKHQLELAAREHPTSGSPPPQVGGKQWLDNMSHRLRTPEGQAIYKRRSATVEPVIGHLKDITKLRRFSRRGITAAAAELDLAAMMINITRLHQKQAT